jgi:RNA polymerase sigma factor for flagellar operon FliA
MPERQDYSALLVQHLPWIERVAASLCRRHGLDPDEADDFASWAKARLMEHDYAALRKFRGESALTTYLTVVVSMLYRDYRVARWGRWRPSAAARRHGPLAVQLETLVYRDGYHWSQAAALLQARDASLTEREITTLIAQLPAGLRGRPVEVGADPLAATPGPARADETVVAAEAEAEQQAAERALSSAMEGLADEDRVILRLRFWEGKSVADVARALTLEQKPLYRRLERILVDLRKRLEAQGVSRERVRALLEEDAP